jgi:hypothetical protein
MASEKKPGRKTDSAAGKRGDPVSYRPHPALIKPWAEFLASFRYPPTRASVLDDALAAFLKAEGYKVPELTKEDSD